MVDFKAYWQAIFDQNAALPYSFFCGDGHIKRHRSNETFTVEEL